MPPSDLDPDRDSLERRLAAVERALADEEPLERADRILASTPVLLGSRIHS
ncbi:hypothetical protein HWV07_14685 [Natronomonas salina]|uniref:hypothetical protein n=1 Tax=Natronomonas salina TaxID=1710540 RepID=UPI0015B4FD0B|nr:hypothetical protein [Natronomonas salina]QLD90212.1 hypothetical protein HWV07_14685 [Natronomonas salina]